MSEFGQTKQLISDPSAHDSPRKSPYVKPAFRHEEVFETRALACGKTSATQGQCGFNLLSS